MATKPKTKKRKKAPKAKLPVGRPTIFSKAIVTAMCDRMASGESVRQVCLDPKMPARAAVHRWLADPANKDFRDQYSHACEERADFMADDILSISDDGSLDRVKRIDRNGREYEQVDSDHINRSRLMVDARFRLMAVMAPKKYSERVVNEISGPGGGPIKTEVAVAELSDNELARRMALILLKKTKAVAA